MYHNLSWNEFKEQAATALAAGDKNALKGLDEAFHLLFFNEVDHGNQETKLKFEMGLVSLLESAEARACPPTSDQQRAITRWEHLDELMEAFRKPAVDLAEAERFLKSREYGMELLDLVAKAGPAGIASGELAEALGIAPQQCSSKVLPDCE